MKSSNIRKRQVKFKDNFKVLFEEVNKIQNDNKEIRNKLENISNG